MTNIGDVFLRLLLDDADFEKKVVARAQAAGDKAGLSMGQAMAAGISKSAATIGRELGSIGQNLSRTGSAMTRNLTLPIVGAGLAVTKLALDFDTSLRQIVALTDTTEEQIGGIRDRILELGPAIGKGPQELAEAFYFIASAGFKAEESMEVLEIAAKAAASGMGQTQDVAKVLAGVINAYGHENLSAATAADQLTAAVQKGSAEAADFAGVIGRVAPGAAALGVSFDQVTAALAGMTNVGISADEAATSLVQIFSSLLKPTTQAEEAMRGLGLTSAGLRRQLREEGLLDTLRTLEERFAGNETASAAVFGNIRALRGVTALLTIDTAQLNDIFAATADSVGSLTKAYDETEGPQREFDRAIASLEASMTQLGEDTLPEATVAITDLATAVADLTKWWKSLDPATRQAIVQFLAITAVAGPLLVVLGTLVSAVGKLFSAVGVLAGPKGLMSIPGRLSAIMKVAGRVAPLLLLVDTLLGLPDAFDAVGDAIDAFGKRAPRAMLSAIRRMLSAIPEPFLPPFMEEALDEIERQIEDFEASEPFEGLFGGWGPRGPIAQRVEEGVDSIATILEDGSVQIGTASDVMADPIAEAIAQARIDAAEETRKLIEAVATVLSTAPEELEDELDAFFEGLGPAFTTAERLAELEGQAARQEWLDAFTSGDPQAIAAAFQKFSTDILDQLELLLPDVAEGGAILPSNFMTGVAGAVPAAIEALKATGQLQGFVDAFDLADQLDAMGEPLLAAYVRGMEFERVISELKSGELTDLTQAFDLADKLDALGDPAGATMVRSLARGLERERAASLATQTQRIRNDLRQQVAVDLTAQGQSAAISFGNGLGSAYSQTYVNQKAALLKAGVTRILEFADSPPYTAIKKIGANVGRFWWQNIVGSVRDGLPQLASTVGQVAGALAIAPGYTGLASYPAQNLTAPMIAPGLAPQAGQAGGGVVNNYNLNVSGAIRVDEARDAIDELRRLAT